MHVAAYVVVALASAGSVVSEAAQAAGCSADFAPLHAGQNETVSGTVRCEGPGPRHRARMQWTAGQSYDFAPMSVTPAPRGGDMHVFGDRKVTGFTFTTFQTGRYDAQLRQCATLDGGRHGCSTINVIMTFEPGS